MTKQLTNHIFWFICLYILKSTKIRKRFSDENDRKVKSTENISLGSKKLTIP